MSIVLDGTNGITTPSLDADIIGGAALASQAEAEAGTDNAHVMTPLRVKNAIDAQVVPKLYDEFFFTVSSSVSQLVVPNLAGFNRLEIEASLEMTSTGSCQIQVSTNNGSTFVTSGYTCGIRDGVAGSIITTGFPVLRGVISTYFGNTIINDFSRSGPAHFSSVAGGAGDRVNTAGGRSPSGVFNALRVLPNDTNLSSGTLRIRAFK